jgi:hypothetical protein
VLREDVSCLNVCGNVCGASSAQQGTGQKHDAKGPVLPSLGALILLVERSETRKFKASQEESKAESGIKHVLLPFGDYTLGWGGAERGGSCTGVSGREGAGCVELWLDAADQGMLEFALLDECASCRRREEPERRFAVCSGCKAVKFCSEACLKREWKLAHKSFCSTAVTKK